MPGEMDLRTADARFDAAAWIGARWTRIRLGLVALHLLLSLPYALLAAYGGDENYHSYTSVAVTKGLLPYADFFFPQGPLTLYVYGIPQAVFGEGMLTVRLTTLALGLGALLLATHAARRAGGDLAAVATGALLVGSVQWLIYSGLFNSVVLAAFLLAASLAVLTSRRLPPFARFALSGALLGLAAGVRLNLLATPLVLVLYAWLATRRAREPLAAAGGAALAAALCYLPFVLADPAGAKFSLLTFHLLDGDDPTLGLAREMKYRLDGLALFVASYPAQVVLLAAALVGSALLLRRATRDRIPAPDLLAAYAAVLALAGIAPNFLKIYIQPYWPVLVLPVAAFAAGVFLARLLADLEGPRGRNAVLLLAGVLLAAPFAAGVPGMVHSPEPAVDPRLMHELAAFVEANTRPDDPILTLRTYLAVWAHRPVVPGLEAGNLAYHPTMPDDLAAQAHVLNAKALHALLADATPAVVILRDDDMTNPYLPAYSPPAEREEARLETWRLVHENYELARDFGEGPGAMHVYLRKAAAR